MKAALRRSLLLSGLIAFAVGWVFLMSLGGVQPAGATGPDGAQATVTRINSDEAFPTINAHILVHDKAGAPIKELPQEAFEVTEDGIPVPITSFVGAGGQVVTAILVIDHSGSMDGDKMAGAIEAAQLFVSLTREERDNLGILLFDDTPETLFSLGPVTAADKERLTRELGSVAPEGGTAFHDAVYEALEQVEDASGRVVIIALTDGQDTDSRHTGEEVIALAQSQRIPLYTVGLSSGWFSIDSRHLQAMADETGGEYFESPSADTLVELYGRIASALQNEYVLGYTSPTPGLDGTQRQVEVGLTYPGGTLRTNRSYAVAGLIKSSLNYPFFGALLLLLLVLLALPSVARRLYRLRPVKEVATRVAPPVEAASPVPSYVPPSVPPVAVGFAPVVPMPIHAPPPMAVAEPQVAHPRLVMRAALSGERLSVGSASGNDLVIPDPTVAAEHARIVREAGRYAIVDLSQGRTAVSFGGDPAEARPVAKNALKNGSVVKVGSVTLRFSQPAQGTPWLDVVYDIAQSGARVGATAENDIPLAHPSVAPRHAELRQEGAHWAVRDLGSQRGTFVSFSGDPTKERALHNNANALKNGSTVRFGELLFVFRTD